MLPASNEAAWSRQRPVALLSRGPSENGMELSAVPKVCGGQEESVGNPQNSYGSRGCLNRTVLCCRRRELLLLQQLPYAWFRRFQVCSV